VRRATAEDRVNSSTNNEDGQSWVYNVRKQWETEKGSSRWLQEGVEELRAVGTGQGKRECGKNTITIVNIYIFTLALGAPSL
jgi:hypothetical protein